MVCFWIWWEEHWTDIIHMGIWLFTYLKSMIKWKWSIFLVKHYNARLIGRNLVPLWKCWKLGRNFILSHFLINHKILLFVSKSYMYVKLIDWMVFHNVCSNGSETFMQRNIDSIRSSIGQLIFWQTKVSPLTHNVL